MPDATGVPEEGEEEGADTTETAGEGRRVVPLSIRSFSATAPHLPGPGRAPVGPPASIVAGERVRAHGGVAPIFRAPARRRR
ncbi:hypothetical protein GCM10010342_62610 [Streptomyces anulatus]|nr:hypothetical protein GCM10010342_62610 [Streptomyces anulatus]